MRNRSPMGSERQNAHAPRAFPISILQQFDLCWALLPKESWCPYLLRAASLAGKTRSDKRQVAVSLGRFFHHWPRVGM